MGKPTGFLDYTRVNCPSRDAAARTGDYAPVELPLSERNRRRQSGRCMDCGVPFCQAGASFEGVLLGCPLHNLIPEWNDLLWNGNYEGALQRLLKTSPFPEFTGRVCPALCERACVCGQVSEPVTIRENERSIIEYGFENDLMQPMPSAARSDKKIAVIGSGPAGLSAAYYLNRRGHHVTVFEKDPLPGGHCSATDHSLQHEVVTSLAVSPDDKLLVGTLCGVDIFNDKTGEIEHWNTATAVNPLSSNFINSLFSKNGQIWVGSETGGVTKLAPRQLNLEFYRHDPANLGSISPNAVNAMYAAADGTLWVGTVEGGLNALTPGSMNFVHYTVANSGLPHNTVSVLAADNRNQLWIGTWGRGFAVMNLSQPGKIIPLVIDAKHQHLLNFAGALAYDPINDGVCGISDFQGSSPEAR